MWYRLKVSAKRAFFGRINNDVNSIYIGIIDKKIILLVLINGEMSKYWAETITEIGTEIIADFDDDYDIGEILSKSDTSTLFTNTNMMCIYQRCENDSNTKLEFIF